MGDPVEARGVSTADRKRLGIRWFQVFRDIRKLKKAGEIEKGMTAADIAMVIMASKMEDPAYESAWQEVGAPDWDALFEFIERLVELFLRIWPMFL